MKNPINVGDDVVVLEHARVLRGKCIKVNNKTYKVQYCWNPLWGQLEKNFKKDKVAHAEDVVTMVCDYKKSPNGMSCRFEYELYPNERRKAIQWHQPSEFVSEN